MAKRRRSIYTALEDLDFTWDLKEVAQFGKMWREGYCITEIANQLGRSENEVALLAMDRHIKGYIDGRPGGLFGKEMGSHGTKGI